MSDELFLLVFVFGEPGFLAIEQVLVRHRVFVVLVQCESLVEEVESFVNKLLLLFFRRGIIFVVDDDPVHATHSIERYGIGRRKLGVLQIVFARFLNPARVLVHISETGNGADIIWLAFQHVLKRLNCHIRVLLVLFRVCIWNELLQVCCSQVDFGVCELRIQSGGFLKIGDCVFVVCLSESPDTLV